MLLPLLMTAACEVVPHAQARVAYAQLGLAGDIGLGDSSGGAVGDARVDLQDDLGLDHPVGTPYFNGELSTLAGNVSLSAFSFSQNSRGQLSGDFGDLPSGQQVATDFDITSVKAFYSYDVLELGPLRLAPGLGIDLLETQTTVSTISAPSAFEEIEVLAPIPMLFVEAEVDLKIVSAEIEVGGSSLSFSDADGTFWDIEAQVVGSIMPLVDLYAGYRFISIDADGTSEGQQFRANLDVQGWFIGGGIRF